MQLAWGRVVRIAEERAGLQRLEVIVDGTSLSSSAIAYPSLTGPCGVGERVLLNTTAVDLGLGTGGAHFVVAGAGGTVADPSSGHIMKLRYTPVQRDVLAVEEAASPHAATMEHARTLEGMPVVCCGLHSQLLPVAAAIKEISTDLRVAYVMTDHAALPLALSDLVAAMTERGLLDTTITAGQAFGGSLEAITTHSALLAARHVARADVAVVALGPGIVGTASPFGHGGVAQGEAINAAGSLGGRSIAVLRLSFTEQRARHHGVSHHTRSALGTVALANAAVVVPALADLERAVVDTALEDAGVWRRHTRVDEPAAPLPDTRGLPMRSMGRSPADDPSFFHAAAAAGRVAGRNALG
jgi:hypothetical protein